MMMMMMRGCILSPHQASHLETETEEYEEKEQQLVNDVVKELRDANHQMSTLAEELARKTDDASRQQEEITHLLSQIVDLQKKSKSVSGLASNISGCLSRSRPMDTFQVAFLTVQLC
uniref:HAP1 N-terminal domain-containing protein n=1 Tax=Hucho hucho TaxID=62062 RepID=A0A4W5PUJ8_9TELE